MGATWSDRKGKVYNGEMEGKVKSWGLLTVEKSGIADSMGRYEDTMVRSWLRLPVRAMSGVMVLLNLGSVLMSVAQFTTKSQVDVHGLCQHQRPRGCLRSLLPQKDMLS